MHTILYVGSMHREFLLQNTNIQPILLETAAAHPPLIPRILQHIVKTGKSPLRNAGLLGM